MECPKCSGVMKTHNTRQNALVEKCTECRSIWLDKGEINFFVKRKVANQKFELNGPLNPKKSELNCPKCKSESLIQGEYPGTKFVLDQCGRCKGTFFDPGELSGLARGDLEPKKKKRKERFQVDLKNPKLISLPSLGFASVATLGGLYAILFGFLMTLEAMGTIDYHIAIGIQVAVILIQFFLGPIIMDFSLRFFGSLKWLEAHEVPENLKNLMEEICQRKKIPVPRFGVIQDSSMNAFTYGWYPGNARVVLTEGVINGLEEEETEAVLAHELGHIVHYDFIFMTLAQMVPIAFYQIYRLLTKRKKKSSSKDGNNGQAAAIGFAAYLLYIISEYVVLYLSRVREYWADRFSGLETKNPNALSSALIKIGYGVMYNDDDELTKEEKSEMRKKRESIKAFGISDSSHGATYGLYAAQSNVRATGDFSGEQASIEAMQWDMWNPWAGYYELHSTHPLIAKRVNAMTSLAVKMGQKPKYVFNLNKPESYWDEFFTDIFFKFLPWLSLVFGALFILLYGSAGALRDIANLDDKVIAIFLMCFGAGGLVSNSFRYLNHNFRSFSILSLLKKIKVSEIRGIPVKIEGRIIGRGVPGYVFSEDLVIQDDTGMIFLDYQQPLALFNILFSIFRSKSYQGEDVIIEGWYRRAPVPFIEVYKMEKKDGSTSSKCWSPFFKRAMWVVILGYGAITYFSAMG